MTKKGSQWEENFLINLVLSSLHSKAKILVVSIIGSVQNGRLEIDPGAQNPFSTDKNIATTLL